MNNSDSRPFRSSLITAEDEKPAVLRYVGGEDLGSYSAGYLLKLIGRW